MGRFGSFVRHTLLATLLAAPIAQATEHRLAPDQQVIGRIHQIEAQFQDTFADLGEIYGFGQREMEAANPGIDPWLPGEGVEITLPGKHILPDAPREGIVVNLPEYRLYFFPPEGGRVITYPVGIGREGWSSPIGVTRVARKEANPSWYPPQSIREEYARNGEILPAVVPPGPDNPMGPYKMNLALGAYVIHGTNKNYGIGMRVSSGCFRLRNEDITRLFPLVPVGTQVRIVNQPFKLGVHEDQLWLEVHTPLDEHGFPSSVDRQAAVQSLLEEKRDLVAGFRLDWRVIGEMAHAEEGIPRVIGTRLR
ncbi:L,D-transpeptidase family protein [Pseudomonas sp.]|uniref:L,D-transpeptidase family protein n=1 Tax=Pseudomonas sp. TaxID=306 RepID=UPI00272CA5E2|nr:L,D-transpeptidase family protein [Pseudomonas sp.]